MLAFALVALIGVANSIEDVAGFTLLQRIVDDEVLARVLGALWGLAMAGLAVGSIATSLLLQVAGNRVALIAIGAILPVRDARRVGAPRSRSTGRRSRPPSWRGSQRVPMFEPLPVATKEQLARGSSGARCRRATVVVRAGDDGDSFYIVGDGRARGARAGGEPRYGRRGDYFGEIALLRDVPRTAHRAGGHRLRRCSCSAATTS